MTAKILVVDDSNTIQKVIRIALSKFALDVVAAGSYAEALSMVGEVQPDVVLADCALSGTKGPEDFTRLAMEASGAPMILLVGSYEDFDESAFRASGFKLCVHKPFESSDIVKAVGDALGAPLTLKKSTTIPPIKTADLLSQGDKAAVKPPDERRPPPPVAEPPKAVEHQRVPPPPAFKPKAPPPPAFAAEKRRGGDPSAADGTAPRKPGAGDRQFHMEGEDTSEIDNTRLAPHQTANIPLEAILRETEAMVVKTIQAEMEHQLPAQVEVAVRRYLEAYCERHFKALAKEILVAEIRRLTDERARQALEG